MNRRNAIRCAFALTLTFAVACGSDTTAPVIVTSVAGTWVLTSVDSRPLPIIVAASDPKQELTDRRYVLSVAGTFTTSFTLKDTELDGTTSTGTTSDSGTYTLADNTVTFINASDKSVVVGTVTPTKMTIGIQEFTKQ